MKVFLFGSVLLFCSLTAFSEKKAKPDPISVCMALATDNPYSNPLIGTKFGPTLKSLENKLKPMKKERDF